MVEPLVSVLIPVYNAGHYLRASLESVLAQSYRHLEVLLINDGSSDGCMESISDIKDSRIRILEQENGGHSSSKNHGLNEMTGNFYIAHDADDISSPFRVERQVKAMTENPDVAASFIGHNLLINGKITAPRIVAKTPAQCHGDIMNFKMPGIGVTPMYRASMVGDTRFDTSLIVAEDLDYILRIGEQYPMIMLPECLYTYRIHSQSSTFVDLCRNSVMEKRVIEKACARRGLSLPECPMRGSSLGHRISCRRKQMKIIPHFMESVLDLRRLGHYWQAVTTAFDCLQLDPFVLYYYKPLFYSIMPIAVIEWYRSLKAGLG